MNRTDFVYTVDVSVLAYVGLGVVAALAVLAVLWYRRRSVRTLRALDALLDAAIQGAPLPESFDESVLSAAQTRLARYLAASALSARQVQAEKDKIKALIADISHQTKTPITNLLLYAQLLGEQDLPEESRACVAALEGQAEKLRALIDALVKTSRLETGVIALHPEACALTPMLEAAAAQFLPRAADKGLTLTLEPTDAQAVFDPKWTEEAVCNLLDNAVKYTPAGGAITIQAVSYELFCRISVTDTGPGIPEAEQAGIFQRFYRAEAVRQEDGVGIGLYLVRQIAEGQGGYVKVFSRPGQGAQFSLYLPRG